MLERIFPTGIASFLEDAPEPDRYRTPDECDRLLADWAHAGAVVEVIGHSRSGRGIRAAVIGEGERTLLAWGYPHPDEPLGTEALVWLGEGLLRGELRELSGWRFVLVLCADPDGAERNRDFLHGERDVHSYARGCWRPSHLGLEVDYGFPLDWGPFACFPDYVGRCRSRNECAQRCGTPSCTRRRTPFEPLTESIALATAIEIWNPDLVAAMHTTHSGGDYTFLRARESRDVLSDLTSIPLLCGQPRHLGEPIDRGRRWRRDAPDLIHERTLDWRLRRLERMPGYNPDYAYQVSASASMFLESVRPDAQFTCPESGYFRADEFGDETVLAETIEALVNVEDRRRGRYQVTRIRTESGWVVAEQTPAPHAQLSEPSLVVVPLTRGMLGVQALVARRRALAEADDLWRRVEALPDLVDHPYLDERWALRVPGAYVSDGAMRIFRVAREYRRQPTIAQAACLRWRWPLHTASLLGNFQNFLRVQDHERPEIATSREQLDAIQDRELAKLPARLQSEAPRAPAIRSMLARVLRLALARETR